MYRCGVSIALLFHTHWTFLHTHPHTHYTTLLGPLGNPCWHAAWRLTCGLRESVCNVAVEVPNEGGDDDEEKLLAISYFYLSFSYLFLFQASFPYRIPNHLARRIFMGQRGKKNMYMSTVIVCVHYLIFHDTNNPIIMTPPLFSILTRYYSFSSSSSPP